MYIKIEISLGHDCNASCVFCYSALAKDKMTMPTDKVKEIIRNYKKRGYNSVSFTGGEPTIRKDILSLISHAKRLGYEVGLKTNLFMLSYPSFVEKLKTAGLDSVSFSVFGLGDDIYRKITGIEKGFSYFAKALDNLKTSPISLTANILISGYSCKDILKLTDFLLSYNISSFWFWYVSSSELTKIPGGLLPCFSSFRRDIFSSIDRIKSKGIDDIKVLHIPMCVLGPYAGYYYNERSDDITLIDLNSTFNLSEESFADLIKLEKCNICIRNEECAGLRKDYQKEFGDSEIIPVSINKKKN